MTHAYRPCTKTTGETWQASAVLSGALALRLFSRRWPSTCELTPVLSPLGHQQIFRKVMEVKNDSLLKEP